jgi:hypothetical protein
MATAQSIAVPPAMIRYGDIIMLGRPVHNGDLFSRRHPKMTPQHRAKIFAPFAALVGFDEHIRSKEIQYVNKHELDADEEWELNRKLNVLHGLTANSRLARTNNVTVSIEYYVPCTDPNNHAYGRKGLYRTITGVVRKVDNVNQSMTLCDADGEYDIAFEDIYDITEPTGALFVRRGA